MRRVATVGGSIGLVVGNALLSLPVGYLGAMTVVACRQQRRSVVPQDPQSPTTKFVIVVPAHNEEATIQTMLDSFQRLEYPRSLVTVHVVADNCDDGTAEVAAAAGVEVHRRSDLTNPGKGPALNWLLDRLVERHEQFDAVVFIDADTSVSPNFLTALDRRFSAGAKAVQGYYSVRDAFASTPATLRYCALACRHHLRPLARTAIGGSCGLFGNAMAFTQELAVSRPWTDHLVEDMEFQIELFLNGINVQYEPDAVVEAEMPHTLASSSSQHQRWEIGRLDLAKRYVPDLSRRLVHPQELSRIGLADTIADLATPPLSLLGLAVAVSAAAGGSAAVLAPHPVSRLNAIVGVTLLTTVCLHVLAALRLVGAPTRAYRTLLHSPRLALWKLMLLLRSLGRSNPPPWVRTRRNSEVDQ